MQKRIVPQAVSDRSAEPGWLDMTSVSVEITSEDPEHPIEHALLGTGKGWRAGEPGVQRVRLLFDPPQDLRRIHVSFIEDAAERTQEFVLRWSSAESEPREIVRQQWNFSPSGATHETEDYEVNLSGATWLELVIDPDRNRGGAYATLARLQLR